MNGVALVTGASRGIGAACARALAKDGWRVAVNYRASAEKAEAVAAEIGGMAFCADVSSSEQVEEMFEKIEKSLGGVDLLVNNAGISHIGLFADMTDEQWRRIFAVNVDGVFNCSRRALKSMIRRHSGGIINISSMWGICGGSCEAAYSATKAAVIGLTKALAKEVGPSNIRVNCVAPGVIDTEMNAELDEEAISALKDETPLGILGTPEDIAALVSFLASDSAKFITGQVISSNGGIVI